MRTGRAQVHLPGLAEAFTAGEVTGEQAGLVARVVEPEPLAAEQHVDLGVVGELLAGIARGRPHADVAKAVHHYLDRLDADGPEPDPTEGRRLVIAAHADGSISGRFDLDAVGGEKLQAALESPVQAGRGAAEERSRAQQLADALVQLCDNQLASGHLPILRGHKRQVLVTVAIEDMVDPATGKGAAELGFGGTVSAARARWPACDGAVTRIVLGPDGVPLDHGRTLRLFPPNVRRAAEVRDGGCVFAGCSAPTWWCDVHHLLEWVNGGETSLANSALLCERHHTKVHHGFRVGRRPDGRWRTWRPDGTQILRPRPHRPTAHHRRLTDTRAAVTQPAADRRPSMGPGRLPVTGAGQRPRPRRRLRRRRGTARPACRSGRVGDDDVETPSPALTPAGGRRTRWPAPQRRGGRRRRRPAGRYGPWCRGRPARCCRPRRAGSRRARAA